MALRGRTIAITGNVECVEDLLVEGHVDGQVWNENHLVTVAASAVVKGDIVAKHITVHGTVDGTLMATGKIELLNEARVTGRVLGASLLLADGAVFNGKAEPQHLEAALKVARHRRTEGDTAEPAKATGAAAAVR